MITVIAGGVGAAKLLRGLQQVVDPADVTAVVNVGDDSTMYGLYVCADLDTVTYTLAGEINPNTGWGLRYESWQAMDTLRTLGDDAWFNLGDRDLGTHMFRTKLLQTGVPLSEVTAQVSQAMGVGVRILPASDDRLETLVTVVDEGQISFQDYFVRRQHNVAVTDVEFRGAETATAAPGVLEAIAEADDLIIAPSNPIVSIGPVMSVEPIHAAVAARRDRNVAVSPIVGGKALKGPADRLMRELGHEPTVGGVAKIYAPLAKYLVIDTADEELASTVSAAGMVPVVAPTIMANDELSAQVATDVLAARR